MTRPPADRPPLPVGTLRLAAVVLVSFAVNANSLFSGFVHDDIYQILGNHWLKDPSFLGDIFTTNVWSFQSRGSNYYRPLMHVIYMIDYGIFGFQAWGYHLTNVLWHAGVSVLVFLVASRLLRDAGRPESPDLLSPPFAAALLFAAHPIHTEVVATAMGIVDTTMAFFCLLSFLFHMRCGAALDSKHAVSVVSFMLAALCKEPALTLPALLLLYDWSFRRDALRMPDLFKRYFPYAAVTAIYLVLRINALHGFAPWQHPKSLDVWTLSINILPLFAMYLEKLLLPVGLNFLHSYSHISSLLSVKGVLSILVAAAFGYAVFVTSRKDRVAFIGLMFIVVPLLPALYIPGLSQEITHAFSERYLYLPSAGFVLVAAAAMSSAGGLSAARRKAIYGGVLIVVALYSAGTIARNPVWKDNYSLFQDTVAKSPGDAVARDGLGHALLTRGRLDEAIGQFSISLELKPGFANALNNLGRAYRAKGFPDMAIELYRQALASEPYFAYAHYNLANAYDDVGFIDQAIYHYRYALSLRLPMPEVHNNLGIAYLKKGWMDKAVVQFETAVRMSPDNRAFRDNLDRARRAGAPARGPGDR